MSGNAFEWVQDCWHNSYKEDGMEDAAPADGSAWESSCSFRNRYFSGLRMARRQRAGSGLWLRARPCAPPCPAQVAGR